MSRGCWPRVLWVLLCELVYATRSCQATRTTKCLFASISKEILRHCETFLTVGESAWHWPLREQFLTVGDSFGPNGDGCKKSASSSFPWHLSSSCRAPRARARGTPQLMMRTDAAQRRQRGAVVACAVRAPRGGSTHVLVRGGGTGEGQGFVLWTP